MVKKMNLAARSPLKIFCVTHINRKQTFTAFAKNMEANKDHVQINNTDRNGTKGVKNTLKLFYQQ